MNDLLSFFIRNILKFENLQEDFEKLMNKYSLNLKLNRHEQKSNSYFKYEDLSLSTIKLINNVYRKDFEMFGYSMINIEN